MFIITFDAEVTSEAIIFDEVEITIINTIANHELDDFKETFQGVFLDRFVTDNFNELSHVHDDPGYFRFYGTCDVDVLPDGSGVDFVWFGARAEKFQ